VPKIQNNGCACTSLKNEEEDVIAGSNREVDRRVTDWRVHKMKNGCACTSRKNEEEDVSLPVQIVKLIGDELTGACTK